MCRRMLRSHMPPLLKRHQAAPLSIQMPPGPPFEENRVKLLISVRLMRGTKATGGFGVEQKGRGQQKCKGGGVGGGAVPRPPHSGPIMSTTLKISGPLMLCFPSPCRLVWLSARFAAETTTDNNNDSKKQKQNNNLSEGDTRIYDANLKERLEEDTLGRGMGRAKNPACYTKDSSRSCTAFNLTATQPHPSANHTKPTGSAGTNPV